MQLNQEYFPHSNYDNNSTIFIDEDNTDKPTSQISFSGCILEHIICNKDISHLEKLFHILASSISSINEYVHGINAAALPAKSWAKMLNCSKTKVFEMQKNIEEKGYFHITRDSNEAGRTKRNKITPVLPNHHLNSMLSAANKYDCDNDSGNNAKELLQSQNVLLKMNYLRRNKLFITIDYQLLKTLAAASEYNCFAKVLFLNLYCKAYISSITKHGKLTSNPKVIVSYKTLAQEHGYSKSVISVAINSLQKAGLISRSQFRCKDAEHKEIEDRKDKSCWEITLNIKNIKAKNIKEDVPRTNTEIDQDQDYVVSDSGHLYIKDIILNNIDNIDKLKLALEKIRSIKSNFFNSQSLNDKTSSPDKQNEQEAYKEACTIDQRNNLELETKALTFTGQDGSDNDQAAISAAANAAADINQTNQNQEQQQNQSRQHTSRFTLKDVKQISKQEAEILQQRSGRGFNFNAMNQILQELQKKGLEKVFEHWYAFRKWFTGALKGEMRQEAIMNSLGYQTKRNREASNPEASQVIEQSVRVEKYLNAVEDSRGNDEYSQLKRKIAGNLEAKAAYEVLTSLRGCRQVGNEEVELEFCQIADKEKLEDTKDALLRAVQSVYGSTTQSLSFKIWQSSSSGKVNMSASSSVQSDTEYLADLPQQTVWDRVRKALLSHIGQGVQNLDKCWFSRLEATEEYQHQDSGRQLRLKAPNSFVRDFVNQNYGRLIEKVCKELGVTVDSYQTVSA